MCAVFICCPYLKKINSTNDHVFAYDVINTEHSGGAGGAGPDEYRYEVVIPVKLIDWSDLNQKQLLIDVRKSCNGQRKCLLNGNILTADCEGNSVKPERFDVTYSCYPTAPDNETVFDMTEVKTQKFFQTNEVFYLSLQPRDPSQTSQYTVEAENTLHVSVVVLSSNTNLQIRCQDKLQYLNDSKTFSKISCVNAKHMSFTVFSDFFTLMQIIVLQRDTIHIVCDTKDNSNTSTDELKEEKRTSKLILICATSVGVVCLFFVIVISAVCIRKRKRRSKPRPAPKPDPASYIVVTPAPGLNPAYSPATATNKVFDPAPAETFNVSPYFLVEPGFDTTVNPDSDPASDPASDSAPELNDVYSHLSHLTQRKTETENVYNG
ncbi:uncharacterized protein LOC131942180 [Physella acuta]|uniref:uncharacterized protein LOC131942180 n=1 Tax=Physella acuta TaxID=109671 RepID=UPI0027DDD852|nr:uncharacterized protein LOC131942180 [Physella acuta]